MGRWDAGGGPDGTGWDAHGPLEINGKSLDPSCGPPWPSSPNGVSSGNSPPRRGRHPNAADMVAVEDVEADLDADRGLAVNYWRDAPAKRPVIVTTRRNARETRGKEQAGQVEVPFTTSLDEDFLSLFAT